MPVYMIIITLLSAFIIAYVSVPITIKLARYLGAMDQPDKRKVHHDPKPRLGGLAIFVSFVFCMLFLVKVTGPFLGIIYGALVIILVGVLDDIFQLSPWLKLAGQIIAAGIAIYFGILVNFVTNPFNGMLNLGYLSIPLTFLWIIGITNAINLIDGLDGLAAGVSAIAATTMAIVALIQGQALVAIVAFVLTAAILGFLPYNFHPARTFMGDCGSNFLGFILACLAVAGLTKSAAVISLFMPIVILGIPIFDTFFAIIRRLNKGAPIFRPDKGHLHHRLMAIGFSHWNCVLIIYGISASFGLVAVLMTFLNSPKATLILSILLLLVILGADKIGMFSGEKTRVPIHDAKHVSR